MHTRPTLAVLSLLLLTGTTALHAAAIDSTLYTTYTLDGARSSVSWTVCGSTQQTSGCYGSGPLEPFGKIGAMIEGNPAYNLAKGTVTRYIYILDIESGSSKNGVSLYVYRKADTITASSDSISVTLFKTINLPLTGGTGASASMAANNSFILIGTDQGGVTVKVAKGNLAVTQLGGLLGSDIGAITTDKYGYITVTSTIVNGVSSFFVVTPSGGEVESGGGAPFMLNTVQATLPSTLP